MLHGLSLLCLKRERKIYTKKLRKKLKNLLTLTNKCVIIYSRKESRRNQTTESLISNRFATVLKTRSQAERSVRVLSKSSRGERSNGKVSF